VPCDPIEAASLNETMWAEIDNLLRTGEVYEFGLFADGASGYVIGGDEAQDQSRRAYSFSPFFQIAVHEIEPYETGKEIVRAVLKTKAEAMKQQFSVNKERFHLVLHRRSQ
jgi:hypothetical protein